VRGLHTEKKRGERGARKVWRAPVLCFLASFLGKKESLEGGDGYHSARYDDHRRCLSVKPFQLS